MTAETSLRSGKIPSIVVALLLLAVAGAARATTDELSDLRRALEEQRARVERQAADLKEQQAELERQMQALAALSARVDALETSPAGSGETANAKSETSPSAKPDRSADVRDAVGDLNAGTVSSGDFPGSFLVPGSRGVSLGIGGFVKTVAIADSNLEVSGADFLPAFNGTSRPDEDGNFAIDATLTRIFLDGRAPAKDGKLRGYIEWDLNGNNNGSYEFKVRHGYGTWRTTRGMLTAGQTWSTLMDLKILPEGLTEPTVSGAIFQRQPILRWTQFVSPRFSVDAALEDPSGNDVEDGLGNTSRSRLPDFIAGVEYAWPGKAHVRVAGIARRLEVSQTAGSGDSATGWGVAASGHLNVFGGDKLVASVTAGAGLGRYLLGLSPTAGGTVDPDSGELDARANIGGILAYAHDFGSGRRATLAVGRAEAEDVALVPENDFRRSTYAYINYLWSPLHYLTLGVEYDYGVRETVDGERDENHRVMFGVQVY